MADDEASVVVRLLTKWGLPQLIDVFQETTNNGDGDAIKVYLRIRPPSTPEGDLNHSGQILKVRPPNAVILKAKKDPKVYTFDHVADINTTQESVFAAVGKTTIESCVAGYNSTIFAYGQTGSGKTFTMLGPSEDGDNFDHELRGVIPRSFEYLFSLVNREREKQGDRFEFLCRVSFLEIYNEQVYDLLDQASTGLQLRENIKKGVFVDGLIEQVVNNPADAYNVLSAGWINRRVASTSMNRESSRSHAVFTVSIESKEKKAGVSNIRVSQLHLVDLAGSERQRDTKTTGVRLKEAGSINRSLSALGNVITALVDIEHGKTRHVPYRDSKLSFLLRDALGGNAKTFIIANVHPGAKCFGETLSTLNFARRAKMIKNKAVVNEDTQGNVTHLQAEIKRLREQLAELNPGNGPHTLPGGTAARIPSVSGSGDQQSSEDAKKWKNNFLDAICLREKADNEMKFMKEKMATLEDLAKKREKAIQSTKMVVRFRESTISRLEKARKEGAPADDKDKIIANQKEEILLLQDQLEHNPTITKYAMENNNLRQEIKCLKGLQSVQTNIAYGRDRTQSLEKLFRDLNAELDGGVRQAIMSPSCSSTSAADNVPVSTLQKHKGQIQQLQAQIESTKQELSEQKEVARKTRMELEADVASYKKACKEYEKSLEGLKVKNRMERDAMNNFHLQTIKTITTPKKRSGYQLRGRQVLFDSTPRRPSDGSVTASIDGSTSTSPGSPALDVDNEGGIVEEDVPEYIVEQCNEALADEIRRLQCENSVLVQQSHEKEADSMKLGQTASKLQHQVENLNQLLDNQRAEWNKKEDELSKQVNDLLANMEVLMQECTYAKSEAGDLKVLLESADRQHSSEKHTFAESTNQHSKQFSILETKLLKLEMEVSNKQKEFEHLQKDRDQLQEHCITLQAENDFKLECAEELETMVKIEKNQNKKMETELQSLLERLDSEVEKNAFLMKELRENTDNQQYELLTALEANNDLQKQNSLLLMDSDEKTSDIGQLKADLEIAMANVTALEKRSTADKDAIGNLMTTIKELRFKLTDSQGMIDNLNSVIYDLRCQGNLLQQQLEEKQTCVDSLRAELVGKDEEMARQENLLLMDKEMLQADFDDLTESNDDRIEEMQRNELELQAMQEELKDKEQALNETMQKLAQKDIELDDTISRYEIQLEEARSNISTVVGESEAHTSELQRLQQLLESKTHEIATIKENETRFSLLFDDYEAMRQEKTQELSNLKTELDNLKIEQEILETKYKSEQYQAEMLTEESRIRETDLNLQCQELEKEVGLLQGAYDDANRDKDQAVEQKNNMKTEFAQLRVNLDIANENQEHLTDILERTRALENTHFAEKENLKSQLGEISEERTKLVKEVGILNKKNLELSTENAKLSGHQNTKQKIQLHVQIKQENNSLREELSKFKAQNGTLKRELQQFKTPTKNNRSLLTSASSVSSEDSPLKDNVKENVEPMAATALLS